MHGDGVNDSSHVGFLLQEKLEKFHVINKSVPGYGGVNQLLVLRETLKDYTPHIVIANYGYYQEERNIFGRKFRENLNVSDDFTSKVHFPRACIKNDSLYIDLIPLYKNKIPFYTQSALMNLLNDVLGNIESIYRKENRVNLEIWKEYISICKKNNTRLIVVLFSNYGKETDKMVSLLKNENIDYLYADISPELTFAPIDFHLNEEGNKKLTKQILDVLEK